MGIRPPSVLRAHAEWYAPPGNCATIERTIGAPSSGLPNRLPHGGLLTMRCGSQRAVSSARLASLRRLAASCSKR